jgi:peptide/nickel transport system substrate-binding protein
MPRNPHRSVRFTCLFAALLFVSLSVVSCGKSDRHAASRQHGVVIGVLSEPKTLNPLVATSAQAQDIVELMFLKLLSEEGDFLSFRPRLASQWSFGDDGLSITFHLRDDVSWHDGEPVTAADVRFTWELQKDERVAWASRSIKDRITDVEVIDDRTVSFHFATRYPYQLHDANDGVILPRHLLSDVPPDSIRGSDFGRHPVGNGPYRFARWIPGQYIELERNPDYYEKGQPYLGRVGVRIVPDMTNLVNQLKAGEIDCLESIPIDALAELESQYKEIEIYRYLSREMAFVVWNLESELFADRAIRRALAMSIDAREIIETLWRGMADVSDSPMHPMLWAHDPGIETIGYDPHRARAIFAEHGWRDSNNDGVLDKDGQPVEFDMTTNQGIQVRADVMTMVQEYLRRVGIKVNARVLEWNTFIGGVINGEFDSCVLGWRVDTRADLTRFWHSSATPPNGFNASRYVNADADALIERAKNTLDFDEARQLWYQCQRIIYEDQPIFFLAVPHEVVGLRKEICGVQPTAYGFFVNLPEWYIDPDCAVTKPNHQQ